MLRVLALLVLVVAAPAAQSDLDALMEQVLARRDANGTKLQQYVLNERETLQVTGPAAATLFGFRREYLWYPRDGRFIKSPVSADGVAIGEDERARFEQRWIEREERRERRAPDGGPERSGAVTVSPGAVESEGGMRDALEPGFVSAAYFLNFKFEPGRYALVGREPFEGRDVLRIEYYPAEMFTEGRTRPNRRIRERDEDAGRKMNKVALVTLWVAPEEHQIVKYAFENIDMDFLPGQQILRFEGATATMEMGQPFPDVWLPRSLTIGFDLTLASGEVKGRYAAEYYDYRLASVDMRLR